MKWFGQRHQTTMIHRQWKERSAWTGFSMGRSSCVFVKPPVLVSQLVFGCFWRGWKISFSTVLYFIGIFQFDKHMQHMFQTSSNHLFQFCVVFFWGGGEAFFSSCIGSLDDVLHLSTVKGEGLRQACFALCGVLRNARWNYIWTNIL